MEAAVVDLWLLLTIIETKNISSPDQQVEINIFLSCWNKNLQNSGSHFCEGVSLKPGRCWSSERHRDTCANCLTSMLGVKGRGHPPNVSSTSFNRAVCHTGYEFFLILFMLLYLSFYLQNLTSVFDINSHWATSKSLGGKITIGV